MKKDYHQTSISAVTLGKTIFMTYMIEPQAGQMLTSRWVTVDAFWDVSCFACIRELFPPIDLIGTILSNQCVCSNSLIDIK